MDPFSITAGFIGITGVAISSFSQLRILLSAYADAHEEVRDISTSLQDLENPLSALAQLHITERDVSPATKDDLQRAGIPEAVNNCGAACAKFASDLERWTKHSSAKKPSFRDRFLVGVWHKEKIQTLRVQVLSCAQILNLAVSSAQLITQLRSHTTSEAKRDELTAGLKTIEERLSEHLERTTVQQNDADQSIKELEQGYDGTREFDQAIEEVKKRVEVLQASQVSSGVVFVQAKSSRSGIDIGKVLTTDDSLAFVGLPASVVGTVNLLVGEVTTQRGSTSHVGVFEGDIHA